MVQMQSTEKLHAACDECRQYPVRRELRHQQLIQTRNTKIEVLW
jgi:hypothetical protein